MRKPQFCLGEGFEDFRGCMHRMTEKRHGEETQALLVAGEGPSAMTELVKRAGAAMGAEGRKARVLLVAPNRNGKLSLIREWKNVWGAALALPRVQTAEEACLFVLDQASGRAGGGRRPYVLCELEERILLEDLKVTGLREGRLKGMLSFFKKGISEGREADPSWLINDEERMVLGLLRELLREREAVLSCELGFLAFSSVSEGGVPAACQADSVFVLGYSSLDASAQRLCRCLARNELVVTGTPSDPGTFCGRFPSPQGVTELDAGLSGASVAPSRRSLLCCADPDAELDTVTECVRAAGACTVIAPNAAWLSSFSRAFERSDLEWQVVEPPALFRGDPREGGSCLAFVAALSIVADPDNVAAWRTYVGLGDWLCASNAWQALRQLADDSGMSARELLLSVRDGGHVCCSDCGAYASALEKLVTRVAEGARLIERCRGLQGSELVLALASEVGLDDPIRRLGIPFGEHDGAAALYRRLHDDALDPMPHGNEAVILTTPLAGRYLFSESVFLVGQIEGFMPGPKAASDSTPHEKREKLLAFDRRLFGACTQSARSAVVCSSFASMDAESAMRSGADIEKIYLSGGSKRARVKRSRFVDGMERLEEGELVS